MNPHLQLAYNIGANTAKHDFEKAAEGEVLTPIMGAIPGLAGPALAGLAGGVTAPEGKGLPAGARSAAGSLVGQVGGGVLGAGAGAGLGAGGAALYNALRKKSLMDKLFGTGDADVGRAATLGASAGAPLGAILGGGYGAYKGREKALGRSADKDEESKEGSLKFGRAPSDASDVASAALGGLPVIGPAAAGLASGMTGPRGLRQTTGMATTGGSAVGQALGGLGGAGLGAGLGAGGAALYNALKRDPTLWERITGGGPQDIDVGRAAGLGAAIGGGAGLVGGGILGAHKGRGYGEERGEQRDAIKAQIIQAMRQRAAMQRGY